MSFSSNTKLLLGFFALIAFISIGVFGLFQFNHAIHPVETPMSNCPYTANGYSICQSTLNHINNWQQFSNIISPSLFIFFILLFAILYIFDQKFLNQKKHFYRWKYYLDNKKLYSYSDTITKWLSLFENSPSLSYLRHS